MRGKRKTLLVSSFLAAAMFCSSANAGPICDLVGKGLDKIGKKIYNCAQKVDKMGPKGKLMKKVKKSCKGKFSLKRPSCGCR